MKKFTLEPGDLATPEGLAAACEAARIFVEENIPGDHRPGPGRFFRKDADAVPVGCCCAVGYLRTALCGSVERAYYTPWSDLWTNCAVPFPPLSDFEVGFDSGFTGSRLWPASGRTGWALAGQ